MNVLILHNRYREAWGEERSVAEIARLLRARGHAVEVLERASATAGRARAARALLAGGLDPGAVERAVRAHRADVVHAHNIHPLFGARALAAARRAGARVVMHLHNYRLVCAIAIDYRDGEVCMRCRGRNTLPGVRLRCRGNLPESVAYGAGLARQQRRTIRAVHRFVAPSAFAARRLADQVLGDAPVTVLHNFVGAEEFADAPPAGRGGHALFAGRLVEEKGADTAIRAAAAAGVPLAVAGTGPDAPRLERLVREHDAPVTFLGRIPPEQMGAVRAHAAFVLAPSRWDEPCPYSVIEAMAAGLPVLASERGGLPEMVGEQAVLPDRDVDRWAAAMRTLWDDDAERGRQAAQAHTRARELFGEERFYSALMDVYEGLEIVDSIRRRDLLGVPVALTNYEEAMDVMDSMIARGERSYVCAVPVHGVMVAQHDPELLRSLHGANVLNVPDGRPLVWALNLLGEDLPDRVYGPELTDRYCARAAQQGHRVWLYGGHDPQALDQLAFALRQRHPGIDIAGQWSPPHRPLTEAEEQEVAARINADRPDVVWVGIGVPKQEKWMARMRPMLDAPVLVGVGAAFDFLAGRKRQAPPWMQRRGLEWLFRLSQEPRRLLVRYLRYNPAFVASFARQYLRERRARAS